MSGSPMGQFAMNGRSYDVIPELASEFLNRPSAIYNLNLRTASGALVPLSNVVTLSETTTPESLSHFQQQRSANISASLAPGYSLGQALKFMETTARKTLPYNITYDFSGTSRQFIQASGSMQQTFIFALLFIFLILAAQFESFIDPFIVMFSVIPAICGALVALRFTGGTMNIYTEIGLVTLIGLISKHGILMVEFANQKLEQGRTRSEAIIESATIRFRPILMTTACMILGALPLALATGAGALSRQQIGITIAGGMLFGTAITLFVVPTAYVSVGKLRNLFRKNADSLPAVPNEPIMSNDQQSSTQN
jgi:multidrug efflux pump